MFAVPCSRELLVFLGVVGFTLVSISRDIRHGNCGNEVARAALMFSVVERGTLHIDGYERVTEDWARCGGHYYSNKAPIPALLGTPIYFVQYHAMRALGLSTESPAARNMALRVVKFLTTTLPLLVALGLFFAVLIRRFRLEPLLAFGLCAAWALGSLGTVYSGMFFGHQTAAAFLGIAIFLTMLEVDRSPMQAGRIFLAGLAAGLSVGSDYINALPVVVWTVWFFWRTRQGGWGIKLAWVLGGAGPALALMAYHQACFGSPFRTAYSLDLMNPVFRGLNTYTLFDLQRLGLLMFSPWRGLFFATPVWVLTLAGVFFLLRRKLWEEFPELLAAAVAWCVLWVYLACLPGSYGGFCIGPRYLTGALPLAALLLIEPAKRFPRLFWVLLAVSMGMMLLASLVNPLPHEAILEPWTTHLLPCLLRNSADGQMNVFTMTLGWPLVWAMAGYWVIWLATAWWLVRRLGGARAAGFTR